MSAHQARDLIERLAAADYDETDAIQAELAALGPDALGEMLAQLPVLDPPRQFIVINVLRGKRDERILAALSPFIESDNSAIAQVAIRAIAAQGTEAAYQALHAALPGARDAVALHLINALAASGVHAAIPDLIALVKRSESDSVRYTAIDALGKLGASEAVPVITQCLDDESKHVRARAERALSRLTTSE
ncbi:MAG: HEAT repeat domain-containing protein [Anaerolineae bacterium]